MMVLGCFRGFSRWKLLAVLLLLACLGYRSKASQYTASDVSYEVPLALTRTAMPSGSNPTTSTATDMTQKDGCCRGTLGYASANYKMPYPCAKAGCCNGSETIAVIPVDEALGFQFVCMPRTSVQKLCYQAGSVVSTSNQDPDHVPRTCCTGARMDVLLNRWYAAMIIKCVDQSEYGER
ncbi:uncharacterized protein [Littorina saxatilis]